MSELPPKLPDGRVVIRDGNLIFLNPTEPQEEPKPLRSFRNPNSIGFNMRRKSAGIAFTATMLSALIATVGAPITTPTFEGPAGPSQEIDGHCPPANPIQIFPQPAPNPST